MASKHFRKSQKFSIEDAFEEDIDDAIRIYGATKDRSPLKSSNDIQKEEVEVKVEDPGCLHDRTPINRSFSFLNKYEQRGFIPVATEPDVGQKN